MTRRFFDVVPNSPQDCRIRPATQDYGIQPNSGLLDVKPMSTEDAERFRAATGTGHLVAHILKCSWCDSSQAGVSHLHIATQGEPAVCCWQCLLKVIESVLGPRKPR